MLLPVVTFVLLLANISPTTQCYKFEVKTDLEPADASDLARASKQGSLLRIKYNGRVYGSGGYGSSFDYSSPWMVTTLVLGIGMLIGGFALIVVRRRIRKRNMKELPPSFREHFHIEDADSIGKSESEEERGARVLFSILYKIFTKRVCDPPNLCANLESPDGEDGDDSSGEASSTIRPID